MWFLPDSFSERPSRCLCQEGDPGRMAVAASIRYLVAPPSAYRSAVWSLRPVSLDEDGGLLMLLPPQLLSCCDLH